MAERCPLLNGLYWNDDIGNGIMPIICFQQCEDLIEQAIKTVPEIDLFDRESDHPIEHGGQSLQRGLGPTRFIGILSVSQYTGDDIFSENYKFECPHN